jgi:hypothetical protein
MQDQRFSFYFPFDPGQFAAMANTEQYIRRLNYPSAIKFRRLRQWAILESWQRLP